MFLRCEVVVSSGEPVLFLSTRLAPGSYHIVRLRLQRAILFSGERLCIQMAARSGSSPRLPFPLSTSGPAGPACELYRGDRGLAFKTASLSYQGYICISLNCGQAGDVTFFGQGRTPKGGHLDHFTVS